jgi:uncharacterized membrane protein HdeD (DUF308 family)
MSDDRTALEVLRSSRQVAYAVGAVCVIAGLVLLLWPDRTWTVVARVAGILLAVVGLGQVVDSIRTHRSQPYWAVLLVRGLINLAVGLVLVLWPDVTVTVVIWLIGLDLVVTGLLGIVTSFRVPAELGSSGLLVQSGISAVLGILIVGWPNATLTVISVIVAAVLLVTGLLMLWTGVQMSRTEDRVALR